jgi:hypothetical protein
VASTAFNGATLTAEAGAAAIAGGGRIAQKLVIGRT